MLRSRDRLRFERRFAIKRLPEISPRTIERAKELPQPLETQVLRAALDGADVRAIKVRKMGKLLLRDALLFSPFAEDSAEGLSGIGIPIHPLYLSLRRPLFDILLVGGLLVPHQFKENT